MDSALQSDLEALRLSDVITLVIITTVIYDYILTLSSEIEYIWNKPWTIMSTLFLVIRYLGLCGFVVASLMGTSLLPGPEKLCGAFNVISLWSIFIFVCAADIVMILRIWAMYNRSKIILGILLTTYLGEVVLSAIASVVYSSPKNTAVTVNQVLDLSSCSLDEKSQIWYKANDLSQLLHSGVMCTLVIAQFTIRSVDMYRATKQWRLGPFFNLLVMQGMGYFFCHRDMESHLHFG